MYIASCPLRVSLFGGSTDYESFYSKHGSLLIGFGINKYCYTSVRETPSIFDYLTRISYSKVEIVNKTENTKINVISRVPSMSLRSNVPFASDIKEEKESDKTISTNDITNEEV